jgi:hypothetical protein
MSTSRRPSVGPWLPTREAVEALGMSRSTLYRLKRNGHLFPGVHYAAQTPGKTSLRLWAIEAIREEMLKWAAPSKPNRESNAVAA